MKEVLLEKDTNTLVIQFRSSNQADWRMMLDQVKSLDGRFYNVKMRVWTAPNSPKNREALKTFGWEVPQTEPDIPVEDLWKAVSIAEEQFPDLRDYQIDSLKFLTWRNGRGLLSHPMGSGKTCQACSYLKLNPSIRPALIVCTASTKQQWIREWSRWTGKDPIDIISGKKPYPLRKGMNYIINWDIVSAWEESILEFGFQVVIADECQALGNPKAKRTKAFRTIGKNIPQFIAMSGTPIRSRPAQFYSVLNLLQPKVFNNYWQYLNRYCDPKQTRFGWTFSGATNLDELHRLIHPLMLRREKGDILKDLPAKNKIVVPLEISKAEIDAYEARKAEIMMDEDGNILDARSRIEKLKWSAFQFKKDSAVQWIKDFLDGDEKLVVFVWHRAVVDFLYDTFKDVAVKLDGSCDDKDRNDAVFAFQHRPEIRLFIGNISAAGVGIDGLQNACSNAVFLEYPWTKADIEQAEDRLHRIGQTDSVNIYYLIAPGTIEDDIISVVDRKTDIVSRVLKGKEAEQDDLFHFLIEKYSK